jgi:hypothetical protein
MARLTKDVQRNEYEDDGDRPDHAFTPMIHAALEAARAHPDYKGQRMLMLVNDDVQGGVIAHGYSDNETLLTDMLANIEAFANTCGMNLQTIVADRPIGGQG